MSSRGGRPESAYSTTTTLSGGSGEYFQATTVTPPAAPSVFPFSFPAAGGGGGGAAPRHASASAPAHVSKTYRQASTLFLTRRLPEALTTLAPLITPPPPPPQARSSSPGDAPLEPPPVATAARNIRIKVWSLYLTLLNAVLEMDPDEGKDTFGAHEWRALCAKVRDGTVWEEVVRHGYHGVEGNVDSDVVINLATLLLAHARDQKVNQKRLETYLTSASAPFDLTQHPIPAFSGAGGARSTSRGGSTHRRRASGANTPRDLASRVKILELYTLHVLLRNNEWEYAREFISVSSVLDDERREAFLQALQSLQEQQAEERAVQEREDAIRREEIARREQELLEARRLREEDELRRQRAEDEKEAERRRNRERGGSPSSETSLSSSSSSSSSRNASAVASRRPQRSNTLGARAARMLWSIKAVVDHVASSLAGNPVMLARVLGFMVGLVLMLSQQNIREKLKRVLAASWTKLKATAGMGVKVSSL